MNRVEMAALLDHSVLKPEATESDIVEGAQLALSWAVGHYCVQPEWVRSAVGALADGRVGVVSVVGFPHGCDRSEVKARAAALAVEDGAVEIDMVMTYARLRSGHAAAVAADIDAVVRAVPTIPVKVILESRVLSDGEKRLACRLAREAGAAFVKTSTGFHPAGGATLEDVRLLRDEVGDALGVKASGGVRTLSEAMAMLQAGANRIGTSASAAILGEIPR